MPLINHAKKEINAKLVYAGPASAGKATNLKYVYAKLKENSRGTFKSMKVQNDSMLFFEFMPPGQGSFDGYSIRFHIYTLTGEVSSLASLKMVLKGADGILFVADSGRDRMAANVDSLKGVSECLTAYGKNLSAIPCVIQYNKQDSSERYRPEEIGRVLEVSEYPSYPATATKGVGVIESIFALVKMVLNDIRTAGINLKGQPEELQQMTEPAGQEPGEQPAAPAFGGAAEVRPGVPLPPEPREVSVEEPSAAGGFEPVVEIAGGAGLGDDGVVRVPLSIRSGGKTTKVTLNISLTAD
ncbi:MAG: hypothetical protein EHM51_02935 [Geobacter sp.]|nr:MAG: hypothetical protein EHM51_02935 [Geobacter sp.]